MIIERLWLRDRVVDLLDDIEEAVRKCLRKTGACGTNLELIIRTLIARAGLPSTFVLVGWEGDELVGLLIAYAIGTTPPVVEIQIVWTKPKVATRVSRQVLQLLVDWAQTIGATQIISYVLRSHERFTKWFHEPLGFKVIGSVVALEVTNGRRIVTEPRRAATSTATVPGDATDVHRDGISVTIGSPPGVANIPDVFSGRRK